jgi:hypothetical protein
MAKVTLSDVKAAQPEWFSRSNKKFFGDLGYRVLHGKKTHKPYLVRETCAWTDMGGGPKRCHVVINPIGADLDIKPLVRAEGASLHTMFHDLTDAKDWLAEH